MSIVKAIVYLVSSLLILLAVSIILNAFVFNRYPTTDCDEIAVTVDMQSNEKLASKPTLRTTFTSTTTTIASTTTRTTTPQTKTPWQESDDQIFVRKCDIDQNGKELCKIVSLSDLDPSERDQYDPRKYGKGKFY